MQLFGIVPLKVADYLLTGNPQGLSESERSVADKYALQYTQSGFKPLSKGNTLFSPSVSDVLGIGPCECVDFVWERLYLRNSFPIRDYSKPYQGFYGKKD